MLGIFYFYSSSQTEEVSYKPAVTRQDWDNLQNFISSIQELWNYPDRLKQIDWKKVECPLWDFKNHYQLVDIRQNFLVLSCLLNGKVRQTGLKKSVFVNQFKVGEHNYFLKKWGSTQEYIKHIKKTDILNDYLPFEGVALAIGKVGNADFEFVFSLSYDQKLKFLPQANYYYGQDLNQLPHKYRSSLSRSNQNFAPVRSWDNMGRYFVIDKMPVRNIDLSLTSLFKEKRHQLAPDLMSLGLVVKYLNLSEQNAFCESRGMQLLDAAIFDAATFYRNIRNYERETSRSLYYFGDRWIGKNKCDLQKTKECNRHIEKDYVQELQISWMGLMSFVEEFESLKNDYDPYFNLHPGSKYFSEKSAWQFLGNRLMWSGLGLSPDEFKWTSSVLGIDLGGIKGETNIPVQFRCMKEWVTYP